jgi:hypothetical protein
MAASVIDGGRTEPDSPDWAGLLAENRRKEDRAGELGKELSAIGIACCLAAMSDFCLGLSGVMNVEKAFLTR